MCFFFNVVALCFWWVSGVRKLSESSLKRNPQMVCHHWNDEFLNQAVWNVSRRQRVRALNNSWFQSDASFPYYRPYCITCRFVNIWSELFNLLKDKKIKKICYSCYAKRLVLKEPGDILKTLQTSFPSRPPLPHEHVTFCLFSTKSWALVCNHHAQLTKSLS